jgi:hypothetical protein
MQLSGQLHVSAGLPPQKEPRVPIGYEAGWAPESVWTLWRETKISFPCREFNPGSEYLTLISKPGVIHLKRYFVIENIPAASLNAGEAQLKSVMFKLSTCLIY